ncbi:MAG: DinB/UmuC family translesion DNA polymerase, partial [Agriterribacter sp.]
FKQLNNVDSAQTFAELLFPRDVFATKLDQAGISPGTLDTIRNGIFETYPLAVMRALLKQNPKFSFENDIKELVIYLLEQAVSSGYELRQDDKMAGCVAVKIRYPDFQTTSRQTAISYTFYDDELIPVAKDLFHKLYRKGEHVRLLGVRLSELTNEAMQTNLFENTEKKSGLYKAIDGVKDRFGKSAIARGRTF